MKIAKEEIERIKKAHDLRAVVEANGIKLKKKGINYVCPFPKEKTPSFSEPQDQPLPGWTPKDVTPHSARQVWWKCRKGHEHRERVIDRYKRGGCPVCTLKARAPRLFEAALKE
jgi:hypothetical protein